MMYNAFQSLPQEQVATNETRPRHSSDATPPITEVVRPDGRILRCLFEAPLSAAPTGTAVLIVPPFGTTMVDLAASALFLRLNGFHTCRFDFANHVGISDGSISQFTLSSAVNDVRTMVDAVQLMFPAAPPAVLSQSLGSRATFRALGGKNVAALVSLVGVVNVQRTLAGVTSDDFVEMHLQGGDLPRWADVLGHQIGRRFVTDLVAADLHTLEATRRDIAECDFSVTNIAGGCDSWIDPKELKATFSTPDRANSSLYVIPEACHYLEKSPSAAREALCHAVSIFSGACGGRALRPADVLVPRIGEILRKKQGEKLVARSWSDGHGLS